MNLLLSILIFAQVVTPGPNDIMFTTESYPNTRLDLLGAETLGDDLLVIVKDGVSIFKITKSGHAFYCGDNKYGHVCNMVFPTAKQADDLRETLEILRPK